jgi:transcriptional regulator with XRE-family HTH domain
MAEEFFKDVGNNILQEIKRRGMTQQELASRLGISKQVMSKIINGVKAINVAEISRIASALAVSVESLLMTGREGDAVEAFSFMGEIKSEKTREKVELLDEVIEEILFLDRLLEGAGVE